MGEDFNGFPHAIPRIKIGKVPRCAGENLSGPVGKSRKEVAKKIPFGFARLHGEDYSGSNAARQRIEEFHTFKVSFRAGNSS
jgi:hypothetical protein